VLRAAVFTLLVASILAGSLEAQRAGGAFGGHAAGPAVRSGFVGQRSVSNRFFLQHGFPNGFFPTRGFFPNRLRLRHNDFGGFLAPYFFPDYGPFWYEQPYAEETSGSVPVVIIQQPDERQSRTLEIPPTKAQVIEVPGAAISSTAKTLPPTIFILAKRRAAGNPAVCAHVE
jgi:hypothetical protein